MLVIIKRNKSNNNDKQIISYFNQLPKEYRVVSPNIYKKYSFSASEDILNATGHDLMKILFLYYFGPLIHTALHRAL